MHFCWDEVQAILMALPYVDGVTFWVSHTWHRLWHRGSPKADGCCDGHDH